LAQQLHPLLWHACDSHRECRSGLLEIRAAAPQVLQQKGAARQGWSRSLNDTIVCRETTSVMGLPKSQLVTTTPRAATSATWCRRWGRCWSATAHRGKHRQASFCLSSANTLCRVRRLTHRATLFKSGVTCTTAILVQRHVSSLRQPHGPRTSD
jgi:hypothetical protein